MRIKRIEAESVPEAMRELRRELGDAAIILHTKQLPARGMTAWFKTPRVEILGAVDEPAPIRPAPAFTFTDDMDPAPRPAPLRARSPQVTPPPAVTPPAPSAPPAPVARTAPSAHEVAAHASHAQPRRRAAAPAAPPAPAKSAAPPQVPLTGYAARRARLDRPARPTAPAARVNEPATTAKAEAPAAAATSVKTLIAEATARQTAQQDIAERLAKFRAAMPGSPLGAAEPRAEALADEPPATGADALTDPLAGITFATPDWTRAGRRPRRIAFVGPTGAGKTTTLAKVAARAQLEQGKRIGIVTIDTYRIGAVPQLSAYADILGAPLAVAETPEALADALARMNDRDLVFIDTIGRSPLGGGVEGLASFLAVAAADEIHLVLSAITRPGDSMRAARAFARLVPNRLSITKLDETEDHSALAMVTRGTGLPLAWLGTGQEVPDDLEAATADRLASLAAAECVA